MMKQYTIWGNEYDVVENLEKEIMENPDDFGVVYKEGDDIWATACEINDEYLEDEKANLNIDVGNDIVMFVVRGLWDGYHNGSRDLHNGNIASVLDSIGCEYVKYYVDDNGDLRGTGVHHDGTNNHLYRAWKDGISEKQKMNLQEKWAKKESTRKDLSRYTRKIGTYVADVYGWKVRR